MDKKRELTPDEMSRVSGGAQQQVSSGVQRITNRAAKMMQNANATAASQVICTIPKGATVRLIGKSTKYSNWFYASYDVYTGFVEGTYLGALRTDDDD